MKPELKNELFDGLVSVFKIVDFDWIIHALTISTKNITNSWAIFICFQHVFLVEGFLVFSLQNLHASMETIYWSLGRPDDHSISLPVHTHCPLTTGRYGTKGEVLTGDQGVRNKTLGEQFTDQGYPQGEQFWEEMCWSGGSGSRLGVVGSLGRPGRICCLNLSTDLNAIACPFCYRCSLVCRWDPFCPVCFFSITDLVNISKGMR